MVKVSSKKVKKVGVGGGDPGNVRDARLKIIAKNRSRMVDARDKLVRMSHASGVDARSKITKIRNLKKGMLDVKTTSKGGITITKTTQGKTLLTTKKRQHQSTGDRNASSSSSSGRRQGKNVTRTVGRGGAISLKTKTKTSSTLVGVAKSKPRTSTSRPDSSSGSGRRLTRTIKGHLSEAAKLDMELLNTKVDPVILKRTVNQDVDRLHSRRRSPSPLFTGRRLRSRSRSPIDVDSYSSRRSSGYHYDDPRRELEREESFSRRMQLQDSMPTHTHRTMADRSFDSHVSPLEGAKVIVSNLQTTVSKDDIIELFGDVGALKRAKVANPGTAEVVFVNRADAQKAVEVYHNRQLDGKAMKCQIVGTGGYEQMASNSSYRLPSSSGTSKENRRSDSRIPPVEMNSIHRALFNDRRKSQPSSHFPESRGRSSRDGDRRSHSRRF